MEHLQKTKIAGMPLALYLMCLGLTAACMYAGVIPQKMIPALLVLMVLGEGLAFLGNTIPVVKTYFGGSVMCVVGGALVTYLGLIPDQTLETRMFLSMTAVSSFFTSRPLLPGASLTWTGDCSSEPP